LSRTNIAALLPRPKPTPKWARFDDARAIITRLESISAAVVPETIPFRNPEHRELFLSGLRVAAEEAK
jgi:hypothetical protein